jgi:hypothetical protein
MKNTKIFPRIFTVVLLVMICAMSALVAYAASNTITASNNKTYPGYGNATTGNPEDSINYINVREQNGLITISYDVKGDPGNTVYVGKIRYVNGEDYMYVYGYYYNSTSSPNTNSLTGWELQTSDLGWGAVAVNKNLSSYSAPLGVIAGQPLTWMNNAYYGCSQLKTTESNFWALPDIPNSVKHTTNMFGNCTGLTKASILSLETLNSNTFTGCSNLEDIYVGSNVATISANAFSGVNANCVINCAKASGYSSGWSNGAASVKYSVDVMHWTMGY